MAFERKFMERAIELAKLGAGGVNPNPLVGAVIVKDGRIIGEGYHAKYGDLHAERNAFKNLTEDASGAQMYVTLEPCCHYGKQPPCVEAIVENKISHVYVGSDDPNEKVAGKGIKYLREHGIEVDTQIMKEECDEINSVFFHYITEHTPYVVMKYAMTLDGKIASYTGKSKWISCEQSRNKVQESRNLYTGIMVGIGTVLADNPMLTCRLAGGRNPVRIICDTRLRIPLDCNIVKTAKEVPTIVAIGESIIGRSAKNENNLRPGDASCDADDKIKRLEAMGVTVIAVKENEGHIDLSCLMRILGEKQIDGILLEGGGTLNYNAIKAGIVKEIQMYLAPKILGGRTALTPVEGIGFENPDLAALFKLKSIQQLDGDLLIKYTS